jgi:hypothetical protein
MLGKWDRIRHGGMQGSYPGVGYASLVGFTADERLLLYGSRLQTHVSRSRLNTQVHIHLLALILVNIVER